MSGFRGFGRLLYNNKKLFIGATGAVGALYGTAAIIKPSPERSILDVATKDSFSPIPTLPAVPVARTVRFPADTSGLSLRLYQYQSCPFCSKVRTFLDYYGFSYEVVEVNPVTRKQLKSLDTKKVPVLVAQGLSNKQLRDSSLVISILYTYITNASMDLDEAEECYPVVPPAPDKKNERLGDSSDNKYFLMTETEDRSVIKQLSKERYWRQWVDREFVHLISPNVYRTFRESIETFRWFSHVAAWESIFPAWERQMVIYFGATAMYFIGRRLKKRHSLKDDVRQSLYEGGEKWLKAIQKTPEKQFIGGDKPNLADLSMYGTMLSMKGCGAFDDLMAHVNLRPWFDAVKAATEAREGSHALEKKLHQFKQYQENK